MRKQQKAVSSEVKVMARRGEGEGVSEVGLLFSKGDSGKACLSR